MRALATWCVRNRWKVIISWLAVLILATVLGQVIGTKYSNDFSLPGTESTRALALLKVSSPKLAGDSEQIVFATSNGAKVTDAVIEQRIVRTLERIQRFNHVTQIVAPFAGGSFKNPFTVRDHHISTDGTIAYATVTLNLAAFHVSQKFAKQFVTTATAKPGANLNVAVAGQIAGQAKRPAVGGLIGAIAAGIVLLLVFGSFAAALMPLISALVALGTATALIGILSNVFAMPEFAPQLVLLIGLGVGVDYALFIVTRHRQGLIEGKDMESSIVQAVNTSGRAVMFAGIIVCIALLGMFALRVTFLSGLAIGDHWGGVHDARGPDVTAGHFGFCWSLHFVAPSTTSSRRQRPATRR